MAKKKETVDAPEVKTLELTLPYVETDNEGYAGRGLNLTLTQRQAVALRYLREGADREQAVLRSGRRVANTQNAIRWLLETIADELGLE